MFRRMIPLTVALAVVVALGCGKKKDTAPGNDSNSNSGGDPNATYTIKIRSEQKGDKTLVTSSDSIETDPFGKGEKVTIQKKREYTETIDEMAAGDKQPTKVTRTYKVAQNTDFLTKQLKAASFEGKTVVATKAKGGTYEFTVDGKKPEQFAGFELAGDFNNPDDDINAMMPKNPVKVGESWNVDMSALKGFAGKNDDVDTSKSKLTAKLTKAYQKDGKQWGVIEFDFNLVGEPKAGAKKKESGTMKMTGTFEAVIDGSSRDGTMKASITASSTGAAGTPTNNASGTVEKTVKTVP